MYVDIYIPKSKTDQYREGDHVIIAKNDSNICPYKLLKKYLEMVSFKPTDYIFCRFYYSKLNKNFQYMDHNMCISYTTMREAFLKFIEKIGLDKKKYGLHSLRSGGTSLAASNGVPDRLIKRQGRWKTEVAKNMYIKESKVNKLLASSNINL